MWLRGEIFPIGVKMTKMGKNGTISDDSFYLMRSRNEGNHMITECVSNKFQFEHNFNAIPKYTRAGYISDSIFESSIPTLTERSRRMSEMLNKTIWKPMPCVSQIWNFHENFHKNFKYLKIQTEVGKVRDCQKTFRTGICFFELISISVPMRLHMGQNTAWSNQQEKATFRSISEKRFDFRRI